MSMSPAAAYALDEAGKVFAKSVGQILEESFSAKHFAWNKVGEVGDDHFIDTQIAPGKEGEIHAAFTRLDSGAEFPAKNIPIPWVGLDKSFSVEDLHKIYKLGGNTAVLRELAEEVLIPMEKAIWIGATIAANHIKVDGFNYNGAGTFLDPKFLDGGASAGKWDAYGKAAKDLVHLHSIVAAAGGKRIGLFYPATAQEAFDFPMPNSATSSMSVSIGQWAKQLFEGGVHPVCDDRSAACCMTGAAETEGSFQICAVDLDQCVINYTQEPMFRPVPYDSINERGNLRYDARIVPGYRVKKIGSYYYKLVAEIDSIDLST